MQYSIVNVIKRITLGIQLSQVISFYNTREDSSKPYHIMQTFKINKCKSYLQLTSKIFPLHVKKCYISIYIFIGIFYLYI